MSHEQELVVCLWSAAVHDQYPSFAHRSWLGARPPKIRAGGFNWSASPKIASPGARPKLQVRHVTAIRYLRYLVVASCMGFTANAGVVLHVLDPGGHRSSGPPSAAGTCWTAAAMNVPTKPAIRTAILIVRFMGSSPINPRVGCSPDSNSRGAEL
jgi:hypothetical protein